MGSETVFALPMPQGIGHKLLGMLGNPGRLQEVLMSDAVINDPALMKLPSQRELLTVMFKGWKLILLGVFIGVLWASNDLNSTGYYYDVQMQVTPAQRNGDSGISAGGGLAGLANLALPSLQSGSDFRLYIDTLKSRNIADELAKDPAIMRTIFAGEWNNATQSWQEPIVTGKTYKIKQYLERVFGFPSVPWHQPDGESLLGSINYFVTVQEDPRRPYIAKIVMNYPDRQFAIQFLTELHQAADNELRQRAIQRTTEYIAYLSDMLSKVTVVEHRIALAQALSEQEKSAMIAKSGSAFAAELFERPWASSYPSYPKPVQTLMKDAFFGALIGGILALLLSAARNSFRARTRRKQPVGSSRNL
jgi:hypothetical protein